MYTSLQSTHTIKSTSFKLDKTDDQAHLNFRILDIKSQRINNQDVFSRQSRHYLVLIFRMNVYFFFQQVASQREWYSCALHVCRLNKFDHVWWSFLELCIKIYSNFHEKRQIHKYFWRQILSLISIFSVTQQIIVNRHI